MFRRSRARSASRTAALLTAGLLAFLPAAGARAADGPAETAAGPARSACRPVSFTTHPVSGDAWRLGGDLCLPPGGTPSTTELLLAGVTYDRRYWELPATPGGPSYVTAALARGHAVLALDRPGTGRSGRPPADDVGLASEAEAVHQVIGALRAGPHRAAARRIVTVGHSFGSSVALTEAADHDDVDALVLTGFLHGVGPRIGDFAKDLHPAAEDPVLAGTHPPDGYLTTAPGTRDSLFYSDGDSLPATRERDEATKSTMTTGEERDISAAQQDPTLATRVRVPVLLAVGGQDALLCGIQVDCSGDATVRGYEAPLYSPAAALQATVLPDAGHAINQHRDAARWFAAETAWLRTLDPSAPGHA